MHQSSRQPSDKRIVIGITGHIGAGKTSAAKHLCSAHGFQYLRYSQVLAEWMANDPEHRPQLQEVGWKVMAEGLQKELNSRLTRHIKPGSNVAVDGLRHPIDYQSLVAKFGRQFRLVYLEAPEVVRWKRKTRFPTIEQFRVADSHPVEQQIDLLKPKAFEIIENEGSLDHLFLAMDKVVKRIELEGAA